MSETELLLKKLQQKLGGNLEWGDINLHYQMQFINAVNLIMDVASARKENKNESN